MANSYYYLKYIVCKTGLHRDLPVQAVYNTTLWLLPQREESTFEPLESKLVLELALTNRIWQM
jgi:hypothetical protein